MIDWRKMNDLVLNVETGNISKNLLDKIENAVGWVISKETPKKIAKQMLIEEIQNSNLPIGQKVAMISNVNKLIKEYCNQYKIIELSLPFLLVDANVDSLDDDWLHLFMDKARLISNEDFQLIWSKILVSEVNAPNSIPKQLLFALEKMGKDDAESFSKLVSISVYTTDNDTKAHSPVFFYNEFKDFYEEIGISFDDIISLTSLGLLQTSIGMFTPEYALASKESEPIKVYYGTESYTPKNKASEICVGDILYTKSGNALCNALLDIVEKRSEYFAKYCIPYWDNRK